MKPCTLLIVPGLRGSGPDHWQTWLEATHPNAQRLRGVDWQEPVLAKWAAALRTHMDELPNTALVVAHSFGCLAVVASLNAIEHKVAGVVLVAPASPNRFSALGLRNTEAPAYTLPPSVELALPHSALGVPGLVIGSSNDPWQSAEDTQRWAACWGLRYLEIANAGHINVDSGFGPWPDLLPLLDSVSGLAYSTPLGNVEELLECKLARKKSHALYKLRQACRKQLV